MKKGFRFAARATAVAATIAAVASQSIGGAAADKLPDVSRSFVQPNGWKLSLSLSSMTVNPVPNLAAQAYTREGFITGQLTALVSGRGNRPLTATAAKLSMQIGCQINMEKGTSIGMSGSLTPSNAFGVGADGTFGFNSNGPSITTNGSVSAHDTVGLDKGLSGSIKGTLLPGTITEIPLGEVTKFKANKPAYVVQQHTEMKIDACGGPVLVRFVARMNTSTSQVDNNLSLYSKPHWL